MRERIFMVYVSSDWHGVPLSVIQALLCKAGFGDDDFLFVLGDVIDRGKHGIELLRWMMVQPNVELILGNHEDMLLECDFLFDEITDESIAALNPFRMSALSTWQMNGAEPTLHALYQLPHSARQEILEYLREAPLYDSVSVGDRDYLLVHGGLGGYDARLKITDYLPHDLLWERPSYDTRYSDDFITIVGHTPTQYYGRDLKGRMLKRPTWWDIDTGASSGGTPMLLCLDDEQEYYLTSEEQ